MSSQSQKPKVVIIGPCYPYRGGIATFVSHVCKLLNTRYDVHLINYSMLYPGFLFPGKTQYDESKSLVFDFTNERLFSSLNPLSWYRTAKRIKQINPEVIIMDWWNPFFGICFRGLQLMLPQKFKKRILVITENVVSHEGRYVDKMLTRLGVTIGQAYVVLSDVVQKQIQQFSADKKLYKANLPIYDQFDLNTKTFTREAVVPKFKDTDFVMLCFGYVRKYKGVDIAIQSLKIVQQSLPQARLLIVGECYDDWQEYEKLITQEGLSEYVHSVTEYVANEDVEQYFMVSDVVLLPYRTATQSGILNVAYGFNKGVVASNVGGFVEFIDQGKTGIVVPTATPQDVAAGALEFYNTLHGKDLTPAIKTCVSRNGFDKILDHVEDFRQSIR